MMLIALAMIVARNDKESGADMLVWGTPKRLGPALVPGSVSSGPGTVPGLWRLSHRSGDPERITRRWMRPGSALSAVCGLSSCGWGSCVCGPPGCSGAPRRSLLSRRAEACDPANSCRPTRGESGPGSGARAPENRQVEPGGEQLWAGEQQEEHRGPELEITETH